MIEAMACGTPVLAFRCGSVPEIVDDGVTGAIVDTHGRGDRGAAARHRARPATRCVSASSNAFPPHAWRRTMSASIVRCSSRRNPSAPRGAGYQASPGERQGRDHPEAIHCLGRARPCRRSRRVPETPFYIPATGSSTRPRRTLKHGDCFAVLDSHADIGASTGGPDGIFFCDTRYLSHLEMLLNGKQPLLLGSSVRDDNSTSPST